MTIAQAPTLDRPIRYVKGVGPGRAKALAQLGVATLEDACLYAPRRYEDRRRLATIAQAPTTEPVTFRATVLTRRLVRLRQRRTIVEATLGDSSGTCQAVWFNQPYLAQQLRIGEDWIFYGQFEPGSRRLTHPELERIEEDDASLHMGRIVPIYPLVSGITQRWVRRLMATVLEQVSSDLEDPLPEPLRLRRGWPPLPEAIRELHFPVSFEAMEVSRARLAFDELLLLQLALAQRRAMAQRKRKPQRYQLDGPLTRGLRERLPFALTGAQRRVLQECFTDLAATSPMARLLQGDVGCGKTIVMAHLLAAAAQSGWQAALMAPTEVLAEQHARVVGQWLEPLGVRLERLSQAVPAVERRKVLRLVVEGRVPIIIGTHALLEQEVAFQRLGLIVIDEQHKFGVRQRATLALKAQAPDVLVMTATPIPRTLALSLYGDLEVSTIDELPPGRGQVSTRWVSEAQRAEAYDRVRTHLSQGHQGYVVYPLIEQRAAQVLRAATGMAGILQRDVFPDRRVALLHGRMSPQQKERIMREFAGGQIHLLVSTVLVEVGLDVPNATVMVIEHPERFGLAQLHQLRGRISRSPTPADCLMISDAAEEGARERLEAFVSTSDGFRLAEQDLEQRGPGELLGPRQHGWLRFRIADLRRDRALLEAARVEARDMIGDDPALAGPPWRALRARLTRFRRRPA